MVPRLLSSGLLLAGLLASTACRPDDVNGGDDSGAESTDGADGADGAGDGADGADGAGDGTDGTSGDPTALQGTWRSEGEDLAPVFRSGSLNYRYVDVTFESATTYSGFVETNSGESQALAGTYEADDGDGIIGTIRLDQTQPEELSSEGIWQVDGDTLLYEIVVVDPNTFGCTPPTPSTGFGTSDCSSVAVSEGDFLQIYRRQ